MSEFTAFEDLGTFIDACKAVDQWHEVRDAHWDLEIGMLVEAVAETYQNPPMLIFDEITGYPEGFRVVSLLFASARRMALAMGLPLDASHLQLTRLAAAKLADAKPIKPEEVSNGPVFEQVFTNDDVDVLSLPSLRFRAGDGGRFIGTGTCMINSDPDSDFINMGTYRMQVHERNLLGLWMSPGQQGRQICERYWQDDKSCPVVATFGCDPLVFLSSIAKMQWGVSELALAGGLRDRPVQVIPGPVTGLPIPAHAEIAIEGEVPPPAQEARDEGPFGEWPGYYSGGTKGTGDPQPVIRIKAMYRRKYPILHDQTPLWPGAPTFGIRFDGITLWRQLQQAGVQNIRGVYVHNRFFMVVSIKQQMGGHALQAGMAALGVSSGARCGRWVIVVDEDIDPSNIQEVLWAMQTRCDPITDIHVVDGNWSTALDPRISPAKLAARDFTNSRAVVLAVRPFAWRHEFPEATRANGQAKIDVLAKFAQSLSRA